MGNRANAETKGRKGEQYPQGRKLGHISEPAVSCFFCGLRVDLAKIPDLRVLRISPVDNIS